MESIEQFLKKYFANIKARSGHEGVFSGRGIGIPVGGAVDGSGDGSKYLGRPRRPISTGEMGSPSQSADSAFSSALAMVNKGYDNIVEYEPMFPEQEEEEMNIYVIESQLYGFQDMKLDLHGKYFDEERIVEDSSYTLSAPPMLNELDLRDLDINLPDFDLPDIPDEWQDRAGQALEIGGELARDVGAIALASAPVVGTAAAAGFVYSNLRELKSDQYDAYNALDSLVTRGSASDCERLQDIAKAMYDDYIDLLQAVTLLIPIVGPAKGILSIIRKLLTLLKKGKATTVLGLGGSALGSAVRSQIFASPIFKFVVKFADHDMAAPAGINRESLLSVVLEAPATLVEMADFIEDCESQRELWDSISQEERLRKFGPDGVREFKFSADISDEARGAARDRFQARDYRERILRKAREIKDTFTEDTLTEGVEMDSDKLIREFIREAIYHETPGFHDPQPGGFEYREPLGVEDPEEPLHKVEGEDPYLVQYKADMGTMEYQSRPESLKEEALRRIIRRELTSLNEKKKSY